MAKKNGNLPGRQAGGTEEPLEKQLWKSADKLRKNIDAAEYKHVVLGLIFLKYISDAFEELYDKLKAGELEEVEWVFLGNGPSGPLRELLIKGGIKISP
jgi:type I restriction enzyme M protein